MLNIMAFLQLFNELFPIVHSAVQVVQQAAPASATGAQKFDAALTAVHSVVNAAPAATTELVNAKAAASSGDTTALSTSIGHMIELSVSICKTFGIFSKAGIVQAAQPLPSGLDPTTPA